MNQGILLKNNYYFSDLSKKAIILCKKNADKNKIKINAKAGSMYQPWEGQKFDLIISDMSPNKTGNKVSDQYKFYNIADSILEFSQKGLMSKGMRVMKVCIGHGFEEFKSDLRENFETVSYFKPKSSRKESRETYVIAKNIRYN